MAIVRTDDEHYKAIANAIRENAELPDSSKIYPEDMPNVIPLVRNNGWNKGYNLGYEDGEEQGYNDGLTVGYENGEKAQYDAFWDVYQENGNKTNYERAFCAFTEETFKPKYDIKPTLAHGIFWGCKMDIDLADKFEKLGRTFDTSKITSAPYMFASSKFTRIGVINTSSMTGCPQMFQTCRKLITIDKLILKEDGSQSFTYTFSENNNLENIVIEGKIGQDVSFTWSTKLTHDSLMSIIIALYDYSDTSTTKTLTIGTGNLKKLTDAEKATATQKGWTLA